MPSLRAQLQIFVIPLFVLLDKPFKANKSADLYPGDSIEEALATVILCHSRPGKDVCIKISEVECSEYDERMNPFFFYTFSP